MADIQLSAVAASHPNFTRRALAAEAVILTGSARNANGQEPAILRLCGILRDDLDAELNLAEPTPHTASLFRRFFDSSHHRSA